MCATETYTNKPVLKLLVSIRIGLLQCQQHSKIRLTIRLGPKKLAQEIEIS